MSPTLRFWIVIGVVAAGTYALRAAPIMLHERAPMPSWLERLLRHVPAAALTALVVPGALYIKSDGLYSFAPERLLAALVALLVALKWRNMLLTLVAGMGALWLLQLAL
jgi:branched-subunit amino acid transport protein